MITEQQKNDLLALLRSHTLTTFRTNQRQKLPIVISSKGTFFKRFWWERIVTVDDDGNIDRNRILTEFIEEISKSPHSDDIIAYLEHAIMEEWYDKRYGIIPVDYFHYDDRWFMYKYSVDEPEYTFGILKVDNMPYNSFEGKRNNRSFVCSMHDLLYNEYCEPFMLFINRKFVNWNYIDIVFDCDDTYLLLHGDQYNRYDLKDADIHMVILPFKVNFIGSEADWHFDMMYNITKDYIQNSLNDLNGNIEITIPSVDEMHEYKGMVYNIGAWLYTQLKYHKLGLLSQDRIDKLSKFDIVKNYKDSAGNIIDSLITKFNALDKDSYNRALYNKITFGTKEIYDIEAIFKFDDDGLLDDDAGNNIIALFDNVLSRYGFYNENMPYSPSNSMNPEQAEYYYNLTKPAETEPDSRYPASQNINIISDHDTRVATYSYNYMPFVHRSSIEKGILFRENYLFFRYGLFYPEYGEIYGYNIKYLAGNVIKVNGPQWYTINSACNVYGENDYKKTIDSYNGVCNTLGSIPDKTVIVKNSYYLKLDTIVFVKFIEENRTSGNDIITLDINSTGPLPIYYMNAPLRYDYIRPYCTLMLQYDGSHYNVLNMSYGNVPYEPIGVLPAGQKIIVEKINDEWGKIIKVNDNNVSDLVGGYIRAHADPNNGSFVWPFTVNTSYIDDNIIVKEFYYNPIEKVKNHIDHFHSQQDISSLSYSAFEESTDDSSLWTILQQLLNCLDYTYSDKLFYKENCDISTDTIIKYDPTLFNPLYHTNASSEWVYSSEANDSRNIYRPYQYETGVGLKIPRYRHEDNESYVIIFENGELIQEYSQMIVYPNFFFIPVNRDIGEIELLWFKDINNNEIHFHITNEMAQSFINHDNEWVKAKISQHIINPDDIKVFDKYPEKIIKYKDLVHETDEIAFNISRKDEDSNLYLMKDAITDFTDVESKEYTAVSSRKFIYQRLYVDQKAYRILLDKRFRYCDNQHQYMLFINGRRMRDDSFLITIPKYSRPFWGMYLYTSRYVNPSDRVELFYVPCPLIDLNIDDKYSLDLGGYLRLDKSDLEVPLDPRLYMFFVNGKKINRNYIIPVDSHTVKIGTDMYSFNNLVINPIYKDTIPEVVDYLKNSQQYSSYDNIIASIGNFTNNIHPDYYKLDYLFNNYTSLSDSEPNMLKTNVGRIAIVNEIVRDFWVTSGYEYNEVPFIYDYLMDEYINNIDRNGNVIIPALDANQIINIDKNDVFIVTYNPEYIYNEIGSTNVPVPKISWGYSNKNIPLLNNNKLLPGPNIVKQYMEYSINGEDKTVDINPDAREWQYNNALTNGISKDIEFKFTGSTGFHDMHRSTKVQFVNGIYYGNVDEDSLQHYINDVRYEWYDRIFALAPKNYIIPSYEEQNSESIEFTMLIHKEYNRVIKRLGYHVISSDNEPVTPFKKVPTVDEMETEEVIDNQNYVLDKTHRTNMRNILIYRKPTHLQHMISSMHYNLQVSPEIVLDNYVIGNNNYFIYACPRRLAFDNDGTRLIEFIMPDPKSDDIKIHCRDDYAIPIYTIGNLNDSNLLEDLDSMKMVYMGEFKYTNHSGYTEWYCMWRSNGFFTRLFDEYGFHINIRYKDRMSRYSDGLGHDILPDDSVEYAEQELIFNRNVRGFSINNLQMGSDKTAEILDSVIKPSIDEPVDPANTIIFINDLNF